MALPDEYCLSRCGPSGVGTCLTERGWQCCNGSSFWYSRRLPVRLICKFLSKLGLACLCRGTRYIGCCSVLCWHDMQLALLDGSTGGWELFAWHPCSCPAAQLRARVMLYAWVAGTAVAALAGHAPRRVEPCRNLQVTDGIAAGHGARQQLPREPAAASRCLTRGRPR